MAARTNSRGSAGALRHVTLALTCLLLSQAQLHAAGGTQAVVQKDQPITKENLIKSLKAGRDDPSKRVDTAVYIDQIRKNGVRFMVTPADERNIRQVGAYLGAADLNRLIRALNDGYSPASAMSGKIEQVKVINSEGGVNVFVQLTVTNFGPPKPARKYMLRVMHVTSARINFNGPADGLDQTFTVKEPGRADVVIRPEDSLIVKTSQSIRTGAAVTGWLRFFVPFIPGVKPQDQTTAESLWEPGIWFVVSFDSVAGEFYEEVFKVN